MSAADALLTSPYLRDAAIGVVAISASVLVYQLARSPAAPRPGLGTRGLKRRQALAGSPAFALLEPAIRLLAGWLSRVPLGARRGRIDRMLVHAGSPLGFTADEFIAVSLLGAAALCAFGLVLDAIAGVGGIVVGFLTCLGAIVPYVSATGHIDRRFREVNRSLPIAIDLISLCMSAGLDFPGALRQVLDKGRGHDALHEELARVLQELGLGHTRRQALEHLADRVPTDPVRDLVAAVVQAEEKGTPLAEILGIQAGMQRMRRSVAAEEAAARAGIKMMIPLTLIFAAIVALLLGPFIVNAMGSGW